MGAPCVPAAYTQAGGCVSLEKGRYARRFPKNAFPPTVAPPVPRNSPKAFTQFGPKPRLLSFAPTLAGPPALFA
jgi:hypothetical protein